MTAPLAPRDARPHDLRLYAPAAAAWVAAAVLAGRGPGTVAVVAAGLALAALVAGLGLATRAGRRSPARVVTAACLAVAAGVAAVLGAHAAAARDGPVPGLVARGATALVVLRVDTDPQRRVGATGASYVVLRATVSSVLERARVTRVRSPVVVIAHGPGWSGLLPSTRVRADVRFAAPRPGGDIVAVALATGPPSVVRGPSALQRAAGRFRAGLREACRGLSGTVRGLVPGLVIGDVSALPQRAREEFRVTGLTHLYAVSGTNVAVVLAAALGLARRLRLGVRLGAVGAALALGAFVVVARPTPSVLRAGVMGLVVVAAMLSGRRAAPLPALGAAVVVLLLVEPGLARQAGFALSVLATVGILLLAPGWRDRLSRRLPAPLADAVAVPAAAQLACAPVLAAYFGQMSLVAVPANLLAAPAVPPATLLGVACALAALVSPSLAAALAGLAGLPAAWLAGVAHWGARLPAASPAWPSGWSGVAALTLLLLAVRAAVRHRGGARLLACVAAGVVVALAISTAAGTASCGARRGILSACPRPPP